MFQRMASLISSMQHLCTQTDKHLCRYSSTGGWPRRAGMGRPDSEEKAKGPPRRASEWRAKMGHVPHLRRSAFYISRTQRSRAGLKYAAPPAFVGGRRSEKAREGARRTEMGRMMRAAPPVLRVLYTTHTQRLRAGLKGKRMASTVGAAPNQK